MLGRPHSFSTAAAALNSFKASNPGAPKGKTEAREVLGEMEEAANWERKGKRGKREEPGPCYSVLQINMSFASFILLVLCRLLPVLVP